MGFARKLGFCSKPTGPFGICSQWKVIWWRLQSSLCPLQWTLACFPPKRFLVCENAYKNVSPKSRCVVIRIWFIFKYDFFVVCVGRADTVSCRDVVRSLKVTRGYIAHLLLKPRNMVRLLLAPSPGVCFRNSTRKTLRCHDLSLCSPHQFPACTARAFFSPYDSC